MPRFTLSKSVVLAGLVLVLALFAEEGLHLYRYDRKGDRQIVWAADRASCKPKQGSSDYVWCDVPGFGKALYRCTGKYCSYQDPSAPLVTLQQMEHEQSDGESMLPPEEAGD